MSVSRTELNHTWTLAQERSGSFFVFGPLVDAQMQTCLCEEEALFVGNTNAEVWRKH